MTHQEEVALLRQEIRSLEHKNTQLSIAISVLKVQYGALLDQFAPEKLKSVYVGDELATRYVE